MGPEMRFWCLVTTEWAQVQVFYESPKYPQGQGFIEAISLKLAGKVNEPLAGLMVITLSSIGWRITSSTRLPDSGNSSETLGRK
jgi:hypothetical protein